jgi:hypothetical protein
MAGRDVGEVLAISEQTLKKRLHEKHLLASVDEPRQTLTVRRIMSGSSKNVLHFRRSTILPDGRTIRRRMSGDGKAFVGFLVGFFVGKYGRPDMRRPFADNNLDRICRVCRAFTAGERPGEFKALYAPGTDLNDVRARR